jgi:hypothetical protein
MQQRHTVHIRDGAAALDAIEKPFERRVLRQRHITHAQCAAEHRDSGVLHEGGTVLGQCLGAIGAGCAHAITE